MLVNDDETGLRDKGRVGKHDMDKFDGKIPAKTGSKEKQTE